jgi:CheY-like chemotaxis protein
MRGAGEIRSAYCMSCGEEVPTYRVEVEGGVEVRCAPCGFTLETAGAPLGSVLECILLADDELLFRTLLADLLVEQKVAREVVGCDGGPALLSECVRRFRAERPISLVILDILMTPMDGSAAALALRALEKGLDRSSPVPILFLSGVRADDSLRQVLQSCGPALYLNKGKDSTPPRLAGRLKELIPHLLMVRSG